MIARDWYKTGGSEHRQRATAKQRPTPPARARYISIREIAARYGVGYDLIYKAIRRGELQAERVGSRWRVTEDALASWFERCQKKRYAVPQRQATSVDRPIS